MKILALADEESKSLWDYYTPGKLKPYDLILSCGDLDPRYLSFVVTMGRAPLYYIHGNHDHRYQQIPPEGCECIEDRIVCYRGLRILGLGGSMRYNPGPHQYSEQQMRRRIRKLRFKLWRSKGVDIVITHAPPFGIGDGEDLAHTGFDAFLKLMEQYKPKYLIHGHNHLTYNVKLERVCQYCDTQVINAFTSYSFDIPDPK